MKFSANNASNIMATKNLLVYCFYCYHILEIVGAKKNEKSVMQCTLNRLSGSFLDFYKMEFSWLIPKGIENGHQCFKLREWRKGQVKIALCCIFCIKVFFSWKKVTVVLFVSFLSNYFSLFTNDLLCMCACVCICFYA